MFCRINKRKAIIDTEFKMRPDAKHARVDSEFFFFTKSLDNVQFMDFGDEFTMSKFTDFQSFSSI